MREGDTCEFCKEDYVVYVAELEPYSPEHLCCPTCDSTYVITDTVTPEE